MRFLADGFEKTSTSMFWTMFEKIQKIVLTMHISDVFQTINHIPEHFTKMLNVIKRFNFSKHNYY